ncbi:MAG: NADP-dependent malic enzyme [Deltaproteobacteria bacterium]|nr:NADP-dependent malic enzyme [Deltaproteobacteria bacterium]
MAQIKMDLSNLHEAFPDDFSPAQVAAGQTEFLKRLSFLAHKFYGGKMMSVPKAGVWGFDWFNVWYTPGVSKISTSIRDDNDLSFELSNRGNTVAVVSDSTRVLGDGNVTPSGGLGVMEGKAFLMKYLGGVDATAICVDSRDAQGHNDPDKIIEFVKMLQPSFGAVNLEDISQPNCFKVLDTLRDACDIPVWHDDAQGTGSVTLAGLINALKLAEKPISEVRYVFHGAGAANTTIARLIMQAGADPKKVIMFDSKGGLHKDRQDIRSDPRFYRKWEICENTNPKGVKDIEEACKGADVLIAVSKPGPDVVKPEWIRSMADKAIVFACANPVPEIYPHAAKEAGAFVVATGRGDFPNQVNNSLGFPGILKGSLTVRAKKVTDAMAVAAARSVAATAEKRGLTPEYIIPLMDEPGVFPDEAAAVAAQAIEDGVARTPKTPDEVRAIAQRDIDFSRGLVTHLMEEGFIKQMPQGLLEQAMTNAIETIRRS